MSKSLSWPMSAWMHATFFVSSAMVLALFVVLVDVVPFDVAVDEVRFDGMDPVDLPTEMLYRRWIVAAVATCFGIYATLTWRSIGRSSTRSFYISTLALGAPLLALSGFGMVNAAVTPQKLLLAPCVVSAVLLVNLVFCIRGLKKLPRSGSTSE